MIFNDYQRIAINWAFAVINGSNRVLSVESVGSRSGTRWDIETVDGWVGVNTVGELCELASRLQRLKFEKSSK